jgi:hypothetical protein
MPDARPATHLQPESSRPIVVIPPMPRSTPEQPVKAPAPVPPAPMPPRSQGTVTSPATSTHVQGSAQQLMHVLAYGTNVAERQQAAERLSASPWATHPEAIQSLVTGARQDAAPAVRVTCIRCLARLNANQMPVVSTLMTLKADVDANVRQEAAIALEYLSSLPGGAHGTPQHAHQASWRQFPR